MDKELYKPIEEKMKKTINVLKDNLANIRAGRANPQILDRLTIDYYGAPTPINQVATVSVPEARVILIQPWEAKLLKDIEKEIQKSDIGINPNNDGKVIRLVFPALTEERRKELTKTSKKEGEDAKVAIRAIRRDSIESMKTKKKNSEITEDDLKDAEKDIQNLTDKYIADIDHIIEAKDKEIMEV
jgi:ribosome recycling factor